jgi:two-component system cell cycle sensor histidine kinase/response regulator CckA
VQDMQGREKRPPSEVEAGQGKLLAAGKKSEKSERVGHDALLDLLSLPAYIVTPKGTIKRCNQAALSLLGYQDSRELVGKSIIAAVYAPSSRIKAEKLLAQWRKSGRLLNEELQVLTGSGGIRDVLLNAGTASGGGKRRYCLTIHIDISAFKQIEQALRREKERSQMYLEMAGVVLLAIDREGRVILANPKACDVLEAKEEQITGRDWFQHFIPEHRRAEIRRVFRELMDGSVQPVEYHENPVLTASGRERWIAWRNTLIRSAEGKVLGTFSSGEDITERRAAEKALRESERKYRELAESLPQVVYEIDLRGELVYVNRNAYTLFGYSEQEFQAGLDAVQMICPEDRERAAADIAAALRGESLGGREYKAIKRDGTCFPVLIHSSRVVRAGRVAGLRGIIIDLTQHKEAERALRESEERLRQSQKMEAVGRLAGGIAHDFNNLLTTMIGYSDLLLNDRNLADEARQEVEEIHASAKRAASLVNQLLAFSRKQVLHPQILDLNKLVSDTTRMLRRLIHENIHLATELDLGIGRVRADPVQLEQVIINLAINARDSMPLGGRLTIATAAAQLDESYYGYHPEVVPGDYLLLSVSDTGQGMDEETRKHLFEPFFTTKEPGKGTGLGLATVFGTVKQSNGYIYVDSEPGRGSTFKIYLPVARSVPEKRKAAPRPDRKRRTGEVILLVEDDQAVRNMTRRSLEAAGYRVLAANDGREALQVSESASSSPIHLLITDLVMPEMSGRELAESLKARSPGLKVLYISGYSESTAAGRSVERQDLVFLEKPYSPRTLAQKVAELLD